MNVEGSRRASVVARAGSRYPLGLMRPRPRLRRGSPVMLAAANERCALITLRRNFVVVYVATVELTPLTAFAVFEQSTVSLFTRLAATYPALLGAPEIARAGTGSQPATVGGSSRRSNSCRANTPTMDSAGGRQAVGRFRGADNEVAVKGNKRAALVSRSQTRRLRGSERSEPRNLTRRRLFEHGERSERSEFDGGHEAEHCREPSAQPRAPVNEPRRLPAPGRNANHNRAKT